MVYNRQYGGVIRSQMTGSTTYSRSVLTLGHARTPMEQVQESADRVWAPVEEFRDRESVPGEKAYGFIAGVYLTDLPSCPEKGRRRPGANCRKLRAGFTRSVATLTAFNCPSR